jgi:hypothetical protein
MKSNASLHLLIREMNTTELLEFAKTVSATDHAILKRCISCYKQLTGKNLISDLETQKNGI